MIILKIPKTERIMKQNCIEKFNKSSSAYHHDKHKKQRKRLCILIGARLCILFGLLYFCDNKFYYISATMIN